MNDPIFNIAQQSLSPLLGISTEQLRKLRKKSLVTDVDFKNDGNRVWYSQAGVERLRNALGVESPAPVENTTPDSPTLDLPAAQSKTTSVKKTPPRVFCLPDKLEDLTELQVYRTTTNKRILEAARVEADLGKNPPVFRVRVRSNENFTRGMRVPVKYVRDGMFDFAGAHMPRWRGKY